MKQNEQRAAKISHECPYCEAKCQFDVFYEDKDTLGRPIENPSRCREDVDQSSGEALYHEPYRCQICGGIIVIKWKLELIEELPF